MKKMNNKLFAGLMMLFVPIILFPMCLVTLKILSLDINWAIVGIIFASLAYFGTALFLIIKGAFEKEDAW